MNKIKVNFLLEHLMIEKLKCPWWGSSATPLAFRCSIFKCGTWWSAVHHTIGYPNMWVSALHHGPWPFFTVDPHPRVHVHSQQLSAAHTTMLGCRESPLTRPSHPRVHVHRPTVVCGSHNCVELQGIPLNLSLISPHK